MPDSKTVRRRRAMLAALVVASLALITAYFGEPVGGGLHAVQRGAQEVLAPLELGASRALEPLRDAAHWTGDTLRAKSENERLREELDRARSDLARAQTAEREAEQLRGLVGLTRQEGYPSGTQPLTARVIARSPVQWYSAIDIDKGESDGVETGQPVVAAGGLVGRVSLATARSARVTLISDADSAVSAQVVPEGARGVIKPRVGRPDDLLLDYIEHGDGVRVGATVITSGSTSVRFPSLFPRGIPIGTVARAEPTEVESYQLVHVRPFADLRRFDFVQVLTGADGSQRAALEVGAGG